MADYRREFYKQSRLSRTPKRDDAQKENRAHKRGTLFDSRRDVEVENKSHFATSTPFHKNSEPSEKILALQTNCVNNDSKYLMAHSPVENEKITRQEAYLKRFIEWKKNKQQESNKKLKRAPFIPCGNPNGYQRLGANASEEFLVPRNHKFRPPEGLVNPDFEKVKRESIYVAVSTPPRHKEQNALKKKDISEDKKKAAIKRAATPKKTMKTNFAPVSKINPSNAPTPSTSRAMLPSDNVEAVNKGAIPKKSIHTKPLPMSVSKTRVVTASNKNVADSKTLPKNVNKQNFTSSAGAKAKALKEKNMPLTKQPERARLAVNLKAKHKLANQHAHNNINKRKLKAEKAAAAIITPLELCKTSDIFNFITSTQVKSPMNTQGESNDIEFSKFCKTIRNSGVAPGGEAINKPKSVKRALLQTTNNTENLPKKFNFLKQQNLGTPFTKSPIKDTLKPVNSAVENPNMKTNKKYTPLSVKASPRRPFLLDDARRKFNFLRKVSLNETTEISEMTLTNKLVKEAAESDNQKLLLDETPKRKSNIAATEIFSGEETENAKRISLSENSNENSKTGDKTLKYVSTADIKEDKNDYQTPERASNYLSSFVSCSRGKVSARKEREKRNSIYLLSTPSKVFDTIKVETPLETRRAREAVLYFRRQLNNEIQRLDALCNKWQAYKNDNLVKLEQCCGNDMIDVAIGQTKLLISKKFMQFSGLIDRCESQANGTAAPDDGSESTKVITPIDLEGFWSMLGLQVENIEKRFNNLDRWKSNDWQDPDEPILQQPKNNTVRPKKAVAAKDKARTNSALIKKIREMRAAMHSAKQSKNEETSEKNEVLETKDISIIKYCSPRRLRRSTLTKTEIAKQHESFSNKKSMTPDRICVIVPDRRSRSIAPTVISIPSPQLSQAGNLKKSNDGKDLLKQAIQTRRSLRKSVDIAVKITPADTIEGPREITSPALQRTPSPTNSQNGYKPILKTPGTARSKSRNVSFNVLCSVQKFRKFGKHLEATEYDQIEKVHIDELKTKFTDDSKPDSPEGPDDESIRTYRLRNRKVKLRPSSEFEIPK